MESKVESTGAFECTLTLSLDRAAWNAAQEKAARRLSRDLTIKGFRPGRAPRRIVESMVGVDRLRTEALETALPPLLPDVLEREELQPAVVPAVLETRDTDDGIEVDLRITLWPRPDSLPDHRDRKIQVDDVDVSDAEIEEQIDRLRDQFAELQETTRAADTGYFVLIDVTVPGEDGEPVSLGKDLLYEVGSDQHLPGLDDHLVGSKAGDIREAPTTFGEREVTARILVKGVRAKKLPELTEEWVSEVTELETVDELRRQIADDLAKVKRRSASAGLRAQLLGELVSELDVDVPKALIEGETEDAIHRFLHTLEAQQVDVATYLRVTGQDESSFLSDQRDRAEQRLRTRILLDAVASAESLEVDEEAVDEVVAELARQAGVEADEYRRRLEERAQVDALRGDILREKALDYLVGCAVAVDASGEPITLSEPEPDPEPEEGATEEDAQPAEVEA